MITVLTGTYATFGIILYVKSRKVQKTSGITAREQSSRRAQNLVRKFGKIYVNFITFHQDFLPSNPDQSDQRHRGFHLCVYAICTDQRVFDRSRTVNLGIGTW